MGKVALISGGIDSIVAALLAGTEDTLPIFVDYGQNSRKRERECAEILAKRYFEHELIRIDMRWYKKFVSPPLCDDKNTLSGHDRDIAYAPFRNSLFIMVASAIAEANGCRQIVVGSHFLDTVYPDNSPEYVEAMNRLLDIAGKSQMTIRLVAPVMDMKKVDIIRAGQGLGIPFEHTWSCYSSNKMPCETCLNCNDRRKAFDEAGTVTPSEILVNRTTGGKVDMNDWKRLSDEAQAKKLAEEEEKERVLLEQEAQSQEVLQVLQSMGMCKKITRKDVKEAIKNRGNYLTRSNSEMKKALEHDQKRDRELMYLLLPFIDDLVSARDSGVFQCFIFNNSPPGKGAAGSVTVTGIDENGNSFVIASASY